MTASKSITKKSRVISSNWPRFLVISSTDDGALKKLSPFAIQKGLVGLAGEPKNVTKIKNGSLLVECLLKSTILANIRINVLPHTSLNSSKGVVRCRDLEGVSDEEICDNLTSQDVTVVRRIKVRRNNELVPTNTFILTFSTPTLPHSIKAGYLNIPVEPFIPNPLRCFKCQKYGHGQNTCRGKLTCARCGQFDHDSKTCKKDLVCTNCKGDHFAYSRECPMWKKEKKVQEVRVEKRLTFADARKLVERFQPARVAASYAVAAAVKVSTRSISVNTDLTWQCDDAKYKKLSDVVNVEKKTAKAAQQQKEAAQKKKQAPVNATTSTQVSLDTNKSSVGLSTGTLFSSLPKLKSKPAKKDHTSGRLKKAEQNLTTSNMFQALDDGGDEMEVSSLDYPGTKRPPPKPKITPILPPDGE
ncbi:uncharacterized protein LOC121389145 [Gigantopelta aegis]|uniref:uncharacterized protein LOC121389145 n=1 Tax=Gigantopelta aegis TaxID=1735272 RepID=UPI001B889B2F|nr:uncharacterized protein LOC121389145 [Gigantopelta aegis]